MSSGMDAAGVATSWLWKDSKSGELIGSIVMPSSASIISGSTWWLKCSFVAAQRRAASRANFTGVELQACAGPKPTELRDEAELIDEAREERDVASEIIDSGELFMALSEVVLAAREGRRRLPMQDQCSDMRLQNVDWAACMAAHMLGRRGPAAQKTLAAGVLAAEAEATDCGVMIGVGNGPKRTGVGGPTSKRGSKYCGRWKGARGVGVDSEEAENPAERGVGVVGVVGVAGGGKGQVDAFRGRHPRRGGRGVVGTPSSEGAKLDTIIFQRASADVPPGVRGDDDDGV